VSERVPLQVLLVEDDEVDRQMVRRYVERSGLRANLHEASSAEDALLFCQANTVDCVILDNRLPDGIGVELAKQMFDQKGDGAPPIIMLTGAGNERVAVAALRTGIHDYLIKEEATPEILEEAILAAIKAKANARREFEQSLVLERQAVTDELTGLGNRRHFDEALDKATANNKEAQIALLVIDLNGFKRVNDNFGHGAGDEVLRQVGQRLKKTVRDGDSPFRLGGDEFAVIMTNSVNAETAKSLAERISGDLGAPYDLVSGAVSVGASIGISHAPADGTTVETLVKAADRRMYANKDRTRLLPVPDNEADRLRDLLSYEVLDTPAEESFDRITRLASSIIGTPIALVSLIDDQRQWFKSKVGLDAVQTPRDIAFCAHAIADDEVMIVPDTQDDERFASNPLVTADPNIRFYAGAPLKSPAGHNLGTLCIIDRVPRSLNKEQEQSLADLASLVVRELELRKAARKGAR
jgi:diguanylate cyclase (GGDEF)-like protein